jgi:CHAT domain-containing protein
LGVAPSVLGLLVLPIPETVLASVRPATDESLLPAGRVLAAALSPDGRWAAFGSDNSVIGLCRVVDGREVRTLIGHQDAVTALAFSPDGARLASRGRDNTVRLWEVASGRHLQQLRAPTDRAGFVRFGPRGDVLLTDGAPGTAVLWHVAQQKVVATYGAPAADWLLSGAISPDGRTVSTCGSDRRMRLWDARTAKLLLESAPGPGWMWAVGFDRQGGRVAAGGDGAFVTVWDVPRGHPVRAFHGGRGVVRTIAFGANDTLWAAGDAGRWTWRVNAASVTSHVAEGAFAVVSGAADGLLWAVATTTDAKLVDGAGRTRVRWRPNMEDARVRAAAWACTGWNELDRADENPSRPIRAFERASALARRPAYVNQLAELYARDRRHAAAVHLLETSLGRQTSRNDRLEICRKVGEIQLDWAFFLTAIAENDEARRHFVAAASWYARGGDPVHEARSRIELGHLEERLHRYAVAEACYNAAVRASEKLRDPDLRVSAWRNLARLYRIMNRFDASLLLFDKVLALQAQGHGRAERARALAGKGLALMHVGQFEEAQGLFEAERRHFEESGNLDGEFGALCDMARASVHRGAYTEALSLVIRAQELDPKQELREWLAQLLTLKASIYLGLQRPWDALEAAEHGLKITRDRGLPAVEGMLGVGTAQVALGRHDAARDTLFNALAGSREAQDRLLEARVLQQLMHTWQAPEDRATAIFFGKQAVNCYQAIRAENQGLDVAARRTFVSSRSGVYRELADLLVASGRIPEALAVLDMLKLDEADDAVDQLRGDRQRAPSSKRLPLLKREFSSLSEYHDLASTVSGNALEVNRLSQRRAALEEAGGVLSPADEERLARAQMKLKEARAQFDDFLKGLPAALNVSGTITLVDVKDELAIAAALRDLGGAAEIYTLVGEDRFRVILITPHAKVAGETTITATELAAKVVKFRQALSHPTIDPRTAANELYNIIVGPIARELKAANPSTVMWSLDGPLRHVPMAALYDGERYMVERYPSAVLTPASKPYLKDLPSRGWHAIGFGVTQARENFSPLPGVRSELQSIVRDPKHSPGGLLPGSLRLDDAFTADAVRRGLTPEHKLLHISSHYDHQPENGAEPYLLLGKGRLSLSDIEELELKHVELLALSACNTGTEGIGAEHESLAIRVQRQGAKAVMASLWSVSDAGTSALMRNFYRLRESVPGITKAEALRRAQLTLIEGDGRGAAGGNSRHIFSWGEDSKFKAPMGAPFAHPYYWAPFVLIGNWR